MKVSNGIFVVALLCCLNLGCGASSGKGPDGVGTKIPTDNGDGVGENGAPLAEIIIDFTSLKNVLRSTELDAAGKQTSVTSYTYDDIGQVTSENEVDGSGEDLSSSTAVYDQNHRLMSRTSSRRNISGITTYKYVYEYDGSSHLLKGTMTDSKGDTTVDTNVYDSQGRVIRNESSTTGSYVSTDVTEVNWDSNTITRNFKSSTAGRHSVAVYGELSQYGHLGFAAPAALISQYATETDDSAEVVSTEKTICNRVNNIVSCTSSVLDPTGKEIETSSDRQMVSSVTMVNAPTGYTDDWNGVKVDFELSYTRTTVDENGKKSTKTSESRFNRVGQEVESRATYSYGAFPDVNSDVRIVTSFDITGLNELKSERYSKGLLNATSTSEY
jgi:hypothetical protein